MRNILMVNVDELWLKGGNRPMYFKALRAHVRKVLDLAHKNPYELKTENQRFVATSEIPFGEKILESLLRVPGVHSVIPARRIDLDHDKMFPAIIDEIDSLDFFPETFKIECKRSNKRYPMGSMDVSREMGHLVLKHYHGKGKELRVDVKKPELKVSVKILNDYIYISSKKIMAVGGLPWGTGGKLVTMLSGGFDSPVASYLMSKRGCSQAFVFFYAYPYVGDEVKEKIVQLASVLGQYQKFSRLYIVPFGDLQNLIAKNCREEYRTLLFRQHMVECSNILGKKVRAEAIVTGDALGQVSSQTIHNIKALEKRSELPIFRPLIGHNKIEIVNLAKKVGTHDISVIPHDDACSLFAPKHPILRPDLEYLEQYNAGFDYTQVMEDAVDNAIVYTINAIGEIVSSTEDS